MWFDDNVHLNLGMKDERCKSKHVSEHMKPHTPFFKMINETKRVLSDVYRTVYNAQELEKRCVVAGDFPHELYRMFNSKY